MVRIILLAIADERNRQIKEEGWTPEHDDSHVDGELAVAAACYALRNESLDLSLACWPWNLGTFPAKLKWSLPKEYRSNLIKAAALIVAEIERLDRIDA